MLCRSVGGRDMQRVSAIAFGNSYQHSIWCVVVLCFVRVLVGGSRSRVQSRLPVFVRRRRSNVTNIITCIFSTLHIRICSETYQR